ncbi:type 1 glutamine amidotransferase [Microlunatus parietis]|uniref:GMP synthase-like glutamine amidotransferase n=1 Tax=Microlunatus parietis TaxID=682979 RepID=A0A7Y9IBR6_9ACTN|nr:type 1 glutamine amidotransferase [Microlunatus parietis]NYE73671.1 GMP synthase-like glutamine amidotransferase [Microlunatus parietis]
MNHRSVLVVQHVPWERPARLGEVLTDHGIGWTTALLAGARDRSDAPAVDTLAGLVLLGGPMGALDVEAYPGLAVEAQLVRECAAAGVPMFGVCLGHQLIATALGAALYPGADREAGIGTVEVVADGPLGPPGTVQPVVHWHGDIVDPPPGATVLARSPGTRTRPTGSATPSSRPSSTWRPTGRCWRTGSRCPRWPPISARTVGAGC